MHLFCLLIFVYAVVPGTLSGLLYSHLNLVMSGHLIVVLFRLMSSEKVLSSIRACTRHCLDVLDRKSVV